MSDFEMEFVLQEYAALKREAFATIAQGESEKDKDAIREGAMMLDESLELRKMLLDAGIPETMLP